MCRDAELVLPPTPDAPSMARRFVGELCMRWGLDAIAWEMSLIVSELVTNAVLHARTPATVRVAVAHGITEAAVFDGDERLPVRRPDRVDLLRDLDALDRLPNAVDAPDLDARHESLFAGDAGPVTAGRGLLIVDALADEWGTSHQAAGKAVWFTLHAPPEWEWAAGCPCAATPVHSTPSGRPVAHVTGPWDG